MGLGVEDMWQGERDIFDVFRTRFFPLEALVDETILPGEVLESLNSDISHSYRG